MSALRLSATNCHLPNLLLYSISEPSRSRLMDTVRCLVVVVSKQSFLFRHAVTSIQLQAPRNSDLKCEKLSVKWMSMPDRTHHCRASFRTDSNEVARFADRIIRECVQNHLRCKQDCVDASSKGYLPLRLLDVHSLNEKDIEIADTAHIPQRFARYLGLSNCWGGRVEIKLTHVKLAQTQLSWDEFLPNCHDAVYFCHKLGM